MTELYDPDPYYICYGCDNYEEPFCDAYCGMPFNMFKRKKKCKEFISYEDW